MLPLMSGCHSPRAAHVIPQEIAACIPSDTVALAGLRLDQIRASALYPALPAAWRALVEPLHDATSAHITYDGRDLLVIAQGHFRAAPPGAVLLSPSLALAGSRAAVDSAKAQRASGRTGAPRLLAEAETVAVKPIWIVLEGNVSVPLAGNFANFNRLLRYVDHATLTADLGSRVDIRLTGVGRTTDDARQLEESLRALVSLAAAGAHDPDLNAVFRSAQVSRQDSQVLLTVSAGMAAVQKLLQ